MDSTGFNNDMFYQFYLNQIKNSKERTKQKELSRVGLGIRKIARPMQLGLSLFFYFLKGVSFFLFFKRQ